MTDERAIIEALGRCSFTPGTFDKRFARTLAAGAENQKISVKQRVVLWKLVNKYRRQLGNGAWPLLKQAKARREAWPERQRIFEDMLDTDPTDYGTREVYADWLEENGGADLAAAHRWVVANKVAPQLEPCGMSYGATGGPINFEWTFGMRVLEMFGTMTMAPNYLPYHHRSQQDAMDALAKALPFITPPAPPVPPPA